MNEKDRAYTVIIERWIVPRCKCGFDLGEQRNDGYIEIYENIYEEIAIEKMHNKVNHNYLKRCPSCGQLLDWKTKEELESEEDE